MSQDQSFLLIWHFILISSEFSHQFRCHILKNRLEESASKNQCCVKICQGIAKCWNLRVVNPSGKVTFVDLKIFSTHVFSPLTRCLQIPMLQKMQKRFCQVIHGLPILRRQLVKFVQYKIGDTFCNIQCLKWWSAKRTFNFRLAAWQNTSSQ